ARPFVEIRQQYVVDLVAHGVHDPSTAGREAGRRGMFANRSGGSSEIADDVRSQPIRDASRQPPPQTNERAILRIRGIVLRNGVAAIETILVMKLLRHEPPVLLERV